MKAIEDKAIEKYIHELPDFQKEIVLRIRTVVLSTDAKLQEAMKWGSIAFFNKKNICGFRTAKTHVTLLFMEGSSLSDTNNLLHGTGAKARTYKVANSSEIDTEGLKALITEALALGM